jgi:hypothetical protein
VVGLAQCVPAVPVDLAVPAGLAALVPAVPADPAQWRVLVVVLVVQ